MSSNLLVPFSGNSKLKTRIFFSLICLKYIQHLFNDTDVVAMVTWLMIDKCKQYAHMLSFVFIVFFLSDTFTCPNLGPLVPLFRISGDVSSGFQSQSGFCIIRIAEAFILHLTPCDGDSFHGNQMGTHYHF